MRTGPIGWEIEKRNKREARQFSERVKLRLSRRLVKKNTRKDRLREKAP